ncbi:hypothetical protein C8R44DRAFT_820684 [Mycena epipterygia]|nr:hypothetical protein C8R44DRAFT_820684 [Mycena epipterygia]
MNSGDEAKQTYSLTVPARLSVPLATGLLGAMIGIKRGGQLASMRFLAENAHRTPTTQKGWYLYHKTKNYRVMLGALRGAARDGAYLGAVGVGWVGLEEGLRAVGWGRVAMSGAGVGTAGLFCALYRMAWKTSLSMGALGLAGGGSLDVLLWWIDKGTR